MLGFFVGRAALESQKHPSLPCQREGDRVSGGGIRSTLCEFAEGLGGFVQPHRGIPRAQIALGNLRAAPFDKWALIDTIARPFPFFSIVPMNISLFVVS